MRVLALFLCLLIAPACADMLPDYAAAHRTTLILGFEKGHCSGTAVGPHVVLSVGHCFEGYKRASMMVNGKMAAISSVVQDNTDHALITITGVTFKKWAKLSRSEPKPGDAIFVIGNPAGFADQLRVGHMTGISWLPLSVSITYGLPVAPLCLYDINTYYGDSGSAIFNRDGRIVGVVSIGTDPLNDPAYHLTGAYPLSFTKAQLHAAGL